MAPPQVANLGGAIAHYEWIVGYHEQNRAVVERVFGEEVEACREMLQLLPLKIAQLQ